MSKRDSFTCILIKDICDFEEGKEGKVLIPRGTIFRQCSSEGPGQGIVLIPVKDGHKIGRRIERGLNRYGETVHYAVYWLEEVAA